MVDVCSPLFDHCRECLVRHLCEIGAPLRAQRGKRVGNHRLRASGGASAAIDLDEAKAGGGRYACIANAMRGWAPVDAGPKRDFATVAGSKYHPLTGLSARRMKKLGIPVLDPKLLACRREQGKDAVDRIRENDAVPSLNVIHELLSPRPHPTMADR